MPNMKHTHRRQIGFPMSTELCLVHFDFATKVRFGSVCLTNIVQLNIRISFRMRNDQLKYTVKSAHRKIGSTECSECSE